MYEDQPPQQSFSSRKKEVQEDNTFTKMFPDIIEDKEQTMIVLFENFEMEKHQDELKNLCFRCPNLEKFQFYNKFRNEKCPQMKDPPLSTIYDNSCFINMEQIGRWVQNPIQKEYPSISKRFPKNLKGLLNQIYSEFKMIPNLERFLLFYPLYLERHFSYYKSIIIQSKFTIDIIYFFSFCAAAQMGSAYIMSRMIKKFIQCGGNLDWILKNEYPENLRKVKDILRIICRSPWALTSQIINEVLDETWTLPLLANILQLIAFVQEMCTISLALGLLPEQKTQLDEKIDKIIQIKKEYDEIIYESKKQKKKLSEAASEKNESQNEVNGKSLREIQKQSIEPYMKAIGLQLSQQKLYENINIVMEPFFPKYEIIEKRRDGVYQRFDSSDYNFQQNSYPVLQGLNKEIASIAYEIIKYSQKMTFDNFGKEGNGNTKAFRRACRYYAENLVGLTHQEYNYKKNIKEVQLNSMPLRFYIRLLIMSPLHIKKQVIQQINHEKDRMECFDLGHIAVMIADTKMSYTLTMITRCFEG